MSKHKNKPKQWHPLFAELLRPMLQDYYDVQINVPVGDLPRESDILLLRRTSAGLTPFRGLWRNLTRWKPHYLQWYGRWLSTLHSEAWKEIAEMARTKARELTFDYDFIAEHIDWEDVIEKLGTDRFLELMGPKKASKIMNPDWLVANLPPEDLKKLFKKLKERLG